MTSISYSELVRKLIKPGADIVAMLSPEQANLWHMATGVAGEAGELLDAIKKYAVYNKSIDLTNVIEELGDLEFFMEGIRQALSLSREDCLEANKQKLQVRYSKLQYSDAEAQERKDKQV